ncbi:MAG: hypothetical protein JW864_06885 [Spirochaetes bacterium]|nr:hypothetical protein [Spirochaetota bacterium]
MSVVTLRIVIGLFLILLGIAGISPNIGESIFSLSNKNFTLEVIFGIVEIICGLIIFLGLFVKTRTKTVYNASLIIFYFWLARIILTKFFWYKIPLSHLPSFMTWALILCTEVVIASSIWLLAKTYKSGLLK